jgi:hypothetical protein
VLDFAQLPISKTGSVPLLLILTDRCFTLFNFESKQEILTRNHHFTMSSPDLSRIIIPGGFDLNMMPVMLFMIFDLGVSAYEIASFKVKLEENVKSAQTEKVVELCTDIKEHHDNRVLKQSQILGVLNS